MSHKSKALAALTCALLLASASAQAEPAQPGDVQEQRLDELKAMKKEMAHMMRTYEARINKLEAEMKEQKETSAKLAAARSTAPPPKPAPTLASYFPGSNLPVDAPVSQPLPKNDDTEWGKYQPGKGFVAVRGKDGELDVTLIAYVRYLNQLGLDPEYTDSFGRTKTLHLRQDIQWNKVNLGFKGWLFDPDFTYRAWVWTQQPAMGEGAQVVVGGQLGYHFNDYLNIYGGIAPLPSTRSTNWTYPFWLKMDNRTTADEFFRASYSQGFWADGKITDDINYRVMIANNLSALGVAASQLDAELNTISGAIWWMPTTGEFGPAIGFGDFEGHDKLATLFGVHYTRSREDKQSQPDTDAIENSQIRLSDGTLLFSPGAFNTAGQVNKATYQMADLEGGFKYEGFSLEGEYYLRWVNDFQTTGFIPVSSLFDHGFQLQASAMILPKQLQAYVAGSEVFGQYGTPWDISAGLNWYPFKRREVHVNVQGIYDSHSPVGGLSYPYIVGGNGFIFNTDVIITF
jgi:hypothetical protein